MTIPFSRNRTGRQINYRPRNPRGRFLVGKTISQRSKEIRKRESFGHWELDTVVSRRGNSRACAATFIERKTRMYLAVKMPDRTAHSMEVAFGVVASQYPQGTFQTATADRGQRVCLLQGLRDFSRARCLLRRPLLILATRLQRKR
ncbi:IS30 family transposase [Cohnella yongneupensis]|uniref:IS30 family transposase n=1 Tax=Cohnella yongneupensis TaxID=425006 RepID=A0ABW0QYU7_9BACL